MKRFARAVKCGVKDFFQRQADHSDYFDALDIYLKQNGTKDEKRQVKEIDEITFNDLLFFTVMAAAHQHTFGVPGSVIKSFKEGKKNYGDMKKVVDAAPRVLAKHGVTSKGQEIITTRMRQRRSINEYELPPEDRDCLAKVVLEINEKAEQPLGMVYFKKDWSTNSGGL